MPLQATLSLARKTLRIDDVYDMPAGSPFGFDRSFDQKVGYRTRSMLVTPLITSKGEVIGVRRATSGLSCLGNRPLSIHKA